MTPAERQRHEQALDWLRRIQNPVHDGWPLFHDGDDNENTHARAKLSKSFAYVEERLTGDYLLGDRFTMADAYLVTVLNWTRAAGIDLKQWPRLAAYRLRLRERPAVAAALEAEGLKK